MLCTFEATGRRDHSRIEPRWFSIRHTKSIGIDSNPLFPVLPDGEAGSAVSCPLLVWEGAIAEIEIRTL